MWYPWEKMLIRGDHMILTHQDKSYHIISARKDGNRVVAIDQDGTELIFGGDLSGIVLSGGQWKNIAEEARTKRGKLLEETDWTQVLDAPIDAATREAYRAYRQALRDLPQQEGFPENITWPELPSVTKADPDPVDTAVDTLLGGDGE